MLLHATDCEEEGGRLSCGGAEKLSTRTWEDAWRELETTVDEGEYSRDTGCTRPSILGLSCITFGGWFLMVLSTF